MSIFVFNFLAGAIVSFLGSLPVGVLNVTIVHIALRRGLSAAFYFAIACAIIELIYSYIAVLLTQAAFQLEAFTLWFHIFSILVFMGAGIYYLRKKPLFSQKPESCPGFLPGNHLKYYERSGYSFLADLYFSALLLQMDTTGFSD